MLKPNSVQMTNEDYRLYWNLVAEGKHKQADLLDRIVHLPEYQTWIKDPTDANAAKLSAAALKLETK